MRRKILHAGAVSMSLLFLFACSGNKEGNASELFEAGEYEAATEAFTKKIEKKGNEPDLLYNRGRCFEELGETEKAKADYHQVLSLNKRHVNARLSLAGIAYQAGNYSRVIILTDKLLEYQEKSAEAHFLQARAKHQLGQAQSALESYTAAISLNDEFGEAYLYRGAVKNSMKFKSACDDFKKAELLGVEGAEKAVEENCR